MESWLIAGLGLVAIAVLVGVIYLLLRHIERQTRLYREHVERLERQVQARTLAEAAAVERAYSPASPSAGEERPRREPSAVDEMFAGPPRRGQKEKPS